MESSHSPTSAEQLAAQLEKPTAAAVWQRVLEVFGDDAKAHCWMLSSRGIFGGKSPSQLVATGDDAELRRVLEVLIRIEHGMFS